MMLRHMLEIHTNSKLLSKPSFDDEEITVSASTPKILIVNSFDEDAAKSFLQGFINAANTGQTVLPVIVDSYGGEIYSLLKMIDVINDSKIPVATVAMGKAMSCGAILVACGTKGHRYASKNSTIMLHDASGGDFGKTSDVNVTAAELKRLNNKIWDMLDERSGKSAGFFKKLVHDNDHADLFITPEQALEYGLIDHIGVPKTKITFDARMEFAL